MATFFERLFAYVIDIFIVSLLSIVIGLGNTDNSLYKDKMKELDDKLVNGEITNKEYFSSYNDLIYDSQKDDKVSLGVSLALNFAYFVVFQGLFHGQTIGKKLFKIKVVDKESKNTASILQMFIRSLFTMSILSGMLNLISLFVFSKNVYLGVYLTFSSIDMIFVLATVICMLYKKDKNGLHDMMAGTLVIKEG